MAKRRSSTRSSSGGSAEGAELQRELIVIAKPEARLRATADGGVRSLEAADITPLEDLLSSEDVSLVPLFGVSEERLLLEAESLAPTIEEALPDLSIFYRVQAPDDQLEGLAENLLKEDAVEAAYITPAAELAEVPEPEEAPEAEEEPINEMLPVADEAPAATPDFTARQGYLNPALGGIDARYAWTRSGGRGAGVRIIDIEGAWRFTHEDLKQNQGGVVGTQSTSKKWRNHGTAVVGVIGGDRNTFGITGICPRAHTRGVSIFGGLDSHGALSTAANLLRAGDIILIELHRIGPNAAYIAIEFWPHDYAAIRYAINKGVIVVEAAGNGYQNLDAAIYNNRPAGFPATWKNPFNPSNPTSGAVVVGAGAPPPGTHGGNHGPDRSRLGFSNYGRRVDCQGWGEEVTATGYGNLQGGTNEDLWYTDTFNGTSSASPIVVGALGCTQGVLRRQGGPLLTPARAISALRATGSPQQDAPGRPATQRIGNRPNLRQLIPRVANVWQHNKRVIRVHAKDGSRRAWAILDGSGWLRVRPTSTDGVTNALTILCEALANDRRVDVFVYNGQIAQATLK
jgi:hypothetical protein